MIVSKFKINKITSSWFTVDSRTLSIFRIFLGFICLLDICRRWDFVTIFYTNDSIIKADLGSDFYKNFTLLNTFTQSWEVYLFFLVGFISSFFLMVGYKTKISQIVTAIVIISIHNRAIILENAGDMFMNAMLIWTAFLPLGLNYSIDALKSNLSKHKDESVEALNDRTTNNKSQKITNLAYFAILFQIAAIYFFTAISKSGYDWSNGSAVFKIFQLDIFLTSFGNSIRDFITPGVSFFLTKTSHYFEYLVPLMVFLPFRSYLIRWILIIMIVVLHLSISLVLNVGLFSHIMIASSLLLLDGRILDLIKARMQKRFTKKYTLFYDSDCGFCHQVARVIKRLDVYSLITIAGTNYQGEKPAKFDELIEKTMILVESTSTKHWIKQKAFGKILSLLPFGFLFSWLFFVPVITRIFEKIYDLIASKRTSISAFFGYDLCGLNTEKNIIEPESRKPVPLYKKKLSSLASYASFLTVLVLLIAAVHYNLVAHKPVNQKIKEIGFSDFGHQKFLRMVASYPRMIQQWNMFSPTVLNTDRTIVAAAHLKNNAFVGLFTNKSLVLNSVDYDDLWDEKCQFWRKFFYRITLKHNNKYIEPFEHWIKNNYNDAFGLNIQRDQIKSFKIWTVHQRNHEMNDNKTYKVYNQLIN